MRCPECNKKTHKEAEALVLKTNPDVIVKKVKVDILILILMFYTRTHQNLKKGLDQESKHRHPKERIDITGFVGLSL